MSETTEPQPNNADGQRSTTPQRGRATKASTVTQDGKTARPTGPITLREFTSMSTQRLTGVGPKRKTALASLGIENLLDLLFSYPRRYIDRRKQTTISGLSEGEEATVVVEVQKVNTRRIRPRMTLTTIDTQDGTGSLRITYFNQPWRAKQLEVGRSVIIFGKCEFYRGYRQMSNPVLDLVGNQTGRIIPVYPNSEKAKIGTAELSAAIGETLRRSALRTIADPVDKEILNRHGLISRHDALNYIHTPTTLAEVAEARKRLIFDELFRIQVALVRAKNTLTKNAVGIEHDISGSEPTQRTDSGLLGQFLSQLSFELTGAQQRAISQIAHDMAQKSPMHRLLQGDVGAGKTLVALAALLMAIQGGHQGALMAPTEVLAEQHYAGIKTLLSNLNVEAEGTLFSHRPLNVALLTNSTTAQQRKRLSQQLKDGEVELLVGTHALIQDSVEFGSLGAVVIDEQHRFGVEQRAALRSKGSGDRIPDVLVMTATPIPRTAAMTVYGDLDVSVLDELPPGRTPIETIWVKSSSGILSETPDQTGQRTQADTLNRPELDAMWQRVRQEIAEGRQAYIVTPLVEESDKIEAASAQEAYAQLKETELSDLRVGLLHGRMNTQDKEEAMETFRLGQLDVLVATTVIEVGVDIGNATVMVILDAHRFGIAQLHQLRGRVGRSKHKSVCYLVSDAGLEQDSDTMTSTGSLSQTTIASRRLEALVDTTDGFALAEIDLELRGEGTIMGQNQKGRSDLRLASLAKDKHWVQQARTEAIKILETDPELTQQSELAEEIDLLIGEESTDYLFKS